MWQPWHHYNQMNRKNTERWMAQWFQGGQIGRAGRFTWEHSCYRESGQHRYPVMVRQFLWCVRELHLDYISIAAEFKQICDQKIELWQVRKHRKFYSRQCIQIHKSESHL